MQCDYILRDGLIGLTIGNVERKKLFFTIRFPQIKQEVISVCSDTKTR